MYTLMTRVFLTVSVGAFIGIANRPAGDCPGCQVVPSHDDWNGSLSFTTTSVSKTAGTCKDGPGSPPTPLCVPNTPCKVWGGVNVRNNSAVELSVQRLCGQAALPLQPQSDESFNVCTFGIKAEAQCGGNVEISIHKASDGSQVGALRWNCAACPVGTGE
jgi:hypothetical protein